MKRVGLVGVTGYGAMHLRELLRLEDAGRVELAAAVVINPGEAVDALAQLRERNCRIFDSAEEMFASPLALDLVTLPTSIASHRYLVSLAQAAHCNVLVEKPVAGSLADALAMRDADRADGHFVAVGFQHVYSFDVQYLKSVLLSGQLGRIKRASTFALWPRDDRYYSRNDWAGMLVDRRGCAVKDSPFNNACAHYLNISLFLCGAAQRDSARFSVADAALYRARPSITSFDAGVAVLVDGTGIELRAAFAHATGTTVNPQIRIECERGSIEWNSDGNWRILRPDGTVRESGATTTRCSLFSTGSRIVWNRRMRLFTRWTTRFGTPRS